MKDEDILLLCEECDIYTVDFIKSDKDGKVICKECKELKKCKGK